MEQNKTIYFNKLMIELRESLNNITLVELARSDELQKELLTIKLMIDDFFNLLNPKIKSIALGHG